MKYPKLDIKTLHLRAYADASFAKNADGTTKIGKLVLQCDRTNTCHVLAYMSRNSRRVVLSIMAGETYAFSDALYQGFMLKHDLETLYRREIPLMMFTDSKQLFDVITKATYPTERRLMIDIAAVRESYNSFDISNIGLVAGKDNPADSFTKKILESPSWTS